ncbi:hypothetical protein F5Y17DRAFT_443015 [Xylariaceae sp. FL0594]|nr:hypothetical protein F5Y17DRAFT_443015 [Xylariaceae sp. FL0594]
MATLTEEAQAQAPTQIMTKPEMEVQTQTGTDTETETKMEAQISEVTIGRKEYLPHTIPLLVRAFTDDAIFKYIMVGLATEEARLRCLRIFIRALIKGAVLNDGLIFEMAEWGCCAVLMPPGRKFDNPATALRAGLLGMVAAVGGRGVKHMLEHGAAVKKAKQKAFPDRKQVASASYWYLFFLATDPSRQRQGLGGLMLEHVKDYITMRQSDAEKKHLPLWLEASSEGSRNLYSRHGFEDVEELTLGVGVVGEDGVAKKGGEGVKTWGMVWRPDGKV